MTDKHTPSEKLASLTADRLIQSGLVRAEKRDSLIAKIAVGQMKGEDWRMEIDLGVEKAGEA